MNANKTSSRKKNLLRIAAITVSLGLILTNTHVIFGLLTTVFPINSSGIVSSANIDVYWESQCITLVSSIDWGSISPGDTTSITVYVKNEGTIPVILSLLPENWNPPAVSTYASLIWDYQGVTLQPEQILQITITLAISENIQGISDFNLDLYITGTEAT
jgi:hypothetical protein